MSYICGDDIKNKQHNLIYSLIKTYQEKTPKIAIAKQWSKYPEHIARLLWDLRAYCDYEGINFNECLDDSWDYELDTQNDEQHF